MSIWDKMNALTKGETEKKQHELKEKLKPKHGDQLTGFINNIRHDKGYGFITSEELPFERIFFHWTGLRQDTLRFPNLSKRMKVEFILQNDNENGYRAIKIKVLE